MTASLKHTTPVATARRDADSGRDRRRGRATARVALLLVISSAACSDSNVPFFTEPTGVDNTPAGIQNSVAGLFASSRQDVGTYLFWMEGFARDEANIQAENPEAVVEQTGLSPIPAGDQGVWDNEYRTATAALAI